MHQPTIELTPRDKELLHLLASGLSTNELASVLQIAPRTIQSRQRRLTAKLGLKNAAELVDHAQANAHPAPAGTSMRRPGSFATILQTKLHLPLSPPTLVARPRLMDALDEKERCPLTLVSAPAGYGKSTLVGQWVERNKTKSAWLSLAEEDSDLRVFLSYFVAAVRTLFPMACQETAVLLNAPELPPRSVLLDSLSNDLEAIHKPFILVLDDYHRIRGEEVHALIDGLLRYPPRPLRLVITTRRDPPLSLASLRARGSLVEIRREDLRCSADETRAVLRQSTGLLVTEHTLSLLEDEIEGWMVGLHLFCVALQKQPDLEALLSGFKGGMQHINDFLLEEVLSQQAPEMQESLLQISLLDRFCPELCTAMNADTGLEGQQFIDALRQNDLFTIPLDVLGRWYRFHHLFQELLSRELARQMTPEELAALHLRACDWFETEGLIDEAIKHALLARDPQRAGLAIERNWRAMMNAGKWHVCAEWLSKLPDEVVQERPELLLATAFRHFYYLNTAAIPPVLNGIETLTRVDAQAPNLSGEIAMFHGFCAYLADEGARSLQHIEYALEQISMADVEFRSQTEILFSLSGHMQGQLDRVTQEITVWLSGPAPLSALRESCLLWSLAFTHYMAGDLQTAAFHVPRLRKSGVAAGLDNFIAWSDYLDGLIHLQQGDLETAIRSLENAGKRKYVNFTRAAADAQGALAIAYQANGQPSLAASTLRSFSDFASHLGRPFEELTEACTARVAVMGRRHEIAVHWLRATAPLPLTGMMSWFIQPCVTRCRALIAEGSAVSLGEAEDRLREYDEKNKTHHNTCQRISILALLAMAHHTQKKRGEAGKVLMRALALAQPGGFVFPFLELGRPMALLLKGLRKKYSDVSQIDRILAVFPAENAAAAKGRTEGPSSDQPLIEPLTNREIDTLRLLAQRLYDKEIAAALSVSTETVRTHLKHIYQKLQVGNRRQAVIKAEGLGLLGK